MATKQGQKGKSETMEEQQSRGVGAIKQKGYGGKPGKAVRPLLKLPSSASSTSGAPHVTAAADKTPPWRQAVAVALLEGFRGVYRG